MPGVEYIELRDLEPRPLRVTVAPIFSLLAAARDAAGARRAGTPEAWCRAVRAHLTGRDYETLAPLATAARVNVPDAILPFPDPPGQSLKDGSERIIAGEESLVRDVHACVSSRRAGDWREPARNPRRWVRSFVVALARAWNGFEPIWQSAQDAVARETERVVVDRAAAHGVDAQLELYPVDAHVFHLFWSCLPEAADAIRHAGEFARDRATGLRRVARPS